MGEKISPSYTFDVDDTLLMFRGKGARPAPLAKEFFEWAAQNCDLRCMTMWAPSGEFDSERAKELADLLKVDVTLIHNFKNPKSIDLTNGYKTTALDFNELKDRQWAWVEDGLLDQEKQVLKDNNVFDNYIGCNVTASPWRLVEVWKILEERFKIPVAEEIKVKARKTIRW